jgi:hypothetical protein
VNWIERQPVSGVIQVWSSIAISASGQYQSACVNNGYVYTSSDFGVNWISRNPTGVGLLQWRCVVMSANGQYQIAGVFSIITGGFVYTSIDYGATWKKQDPAGSMKSASGQYISACGYNDYIYTSVTPYGTISVSNTMTITGNTSSNSTTSGAFLVTGGVGIGGNTYIGGNLWVGNKTIMVGNVYIGNTLASISPTTGAFVVEGGVGIVGNLVVKGGIYMNGNLVGTGSGSLSSNSDISLNGNLYVNSMFPSSSTITGAVIVKGGVAIQGSTYTKKINITDVADAGTTTDQNASLYTAGGVAITKKIWVGGRANLRNGLNIYEATGTDATGSDGTIFLSHGNTGGVSSIVFESHNNNSSDYGYIKYQDDAAISGTGESSILTIGVENDNNLTDSIYIKTPNGGFTKFGSNNNTTNVGINKVPTTTLDVNGELTVNNTVTLTGSNAKIYFDTRTSTNCISFGNSSYIYDDTNLKITTDDTTHFVQNGTTRLTVTTTGITVNGITSSTSFNTASDYRIKGNVHTLDTTYVIDKLRPVKYYNKILEKEDMGFIAHEVQEEYPFLVHGEKDGENHQSINYSGIISLLVNEIQTLKKEVKELKARMIM